MLGVSVSALSALLLLIAAIGSWWLSPVLTAVLVLLAGAILTGWQIYRRRAKVPRTDLPTWAAVTVPLAFGALAVVALNGWIYRISADAGGESGTLGMLVGLVTGVVGMSFAYGYGRVRAQRAQLREVGAAADDDEDEPDWFFTTGDPRP